MGFVLLFAQAASMVVVLPGGTYNPDLASILLKGNDRVRDNAADARPSGGTGRARQSQPSRSGAAARHALEVAPASRHDRHGTGAHSSAAGPDPSLASNASRLTPANLAELEVLHKLEARKEKRSDAHGVLPAALTAITVTEMRPNRCVVHVL
jgi:hypothetical protein